MQALSTETPAVRTASYHLLETLLAYGVEHLFCNLGTDHAPLIEEMALWRKEGRALPNVILCPHENTAVHMAGGYAAATGRGQAVLVHVDAGTANSAMGLHNLFRARIPILLIAGKAPVTTFNGIPGERDTYVHFIQEPFDQGSMVRPYVKWEYTLPSPSMAAEVIARAHSVMQTAPQGPVYLMLPREVLAAQCPVKELHAFPPAAHAPVRSGIAAPSAIAEIAKRLIDADNPLLVTAYAGRNPSTPALVDQLARLVGMRVCEFNAVHLNIRRDSPCFSGYQPGPHAQTADVGLLLDIDVPWIPQKTQLRPDSWWGQIDVDALKRDIPLWGFPTHVRIEGDSASILPQLIETIEAQATPAFRARAAQRLEQLAQEHATRTRSVSALAQEPGTVTAINPHYLMAALGRQLDANDIVLNEAIRNTQAVFDQIPRTEPGTLIGLPGGGLGFSAGMALGIKLANPTRQVVHVVGDGAFYFSNPSSVYAVAKGYGLPILTVVLDNSGWSAVKASILRMYPDGHARSTDEFASRLPTDMDFAGIAEAAGAYGERLSDPADCEAAIARCLQALREGRSALLHARVTPL